ncbi:MAG: hypothetical protein O2943_06955 [Actinomycetota bacterium]|nr:hypothetical protein [Actinomycetota bacterium]
MQTRIIASATAIAIGFVGATFAIAPAAQAVAGTITPYYSNGQLWAAPPTGGPSLTYNQKLTVYARSTTGQTIGFSVSGGCSVEYVGQTPVPSSQATVTGTSGALDCNLTMTSPAGNGLDAATVTYTLLARQGGQGVTFGSVMSKTTVKTGKTYVLAANPLKTTQGQTVTIAINTGSKYCSVKKSSSKGWLLKVKGTPPGKCSVVATSAGVPPNYAPFSRKQYWSVVK